MRKLILWINGFLKSADGNLAVTDTDHKTMIDWRSAGHSALSPKWAPAHGNISWSDGLLLCLGSNSLAARPVSEITALQVAWN